MAKARRARPRIGRAVVAILVALVVLAGGALAVWRLSSGSSTSAKPPASAAPTTAVTANGQSPQPTQSSSASDSPSAPGGTELAACQAKVRAADAVIREAQVGVGHWSEHVQAQTNGNAGVITVPEMDAIFKRTRMAGPGDVQRYSQAVAAYRAQTGTCSAASGASGSVGDTLASCSDREKAQGPVLAAAADAMADWKTHLATMQRSKMGHVANPQGVWIQTWRAAPPHINAFKKAIRDFHAPSC